MARTEFNLRDAYIQAFGYIAKPRIYPGLSDKATAEKAQTSALKNGKFELSNGGEYKGLKAFASEERGKSLMGTPLYFPVQMQISKPGEELRYWKLPNEPLISISGGKNIIKTQIDGQDGTFKELFSKADYQITIRGICIQDDGTSDDDSYPEEQVLKIRQILEIKKGVKVVCEFLRLFGIDMLAIESYRFPDLVGSPNMQPYEIVCSSDKEFDLELKTQGI